MFGADSASFSTLKCAVLSRPQHLGGSLTASFDAIGPKAGPRPPPRRRAGRLPGHFRRQIRRRDIVPLIGGTTYRAADRQHRAAGTITPGNTVPGYCPAPFRSAGNPSPPGTAPPVGGTISGRQKRHVPKCRVAGGCRVAEGYRDTRGTEGCQRPHCAVLPIGSTVPCQNRAVKRRHRISRRHYAGRNRSGTPSPHGQSPN